jgi:hypothetical protein
MKPIVFISTFQFHRSSVKLVIKSLLFSPELHKCQKTKPYYCLTKIKTEQTLYFVNVYALKLETVF